MIGFEAAHRWQEAANDLLTRSSISVADAMNAFSCIGQLARNHLISLPGKDAEVQLYKPQIVPAAVLFHLAFTGQAIVKDLNNLKGQPPSGTALETALRLGEDKPPSYASKPVSETDRYFTADSDPSQEIAVLDARQAPGLVIEGPPGTGKSQTIVNMVADSVGRQKSLLVICQKQAALDVVKKRLERERLGSRLVMVTDINRDRQPIIRSIREQLDDLYARPKAVQTWKLERNRVAAKIEALESDLNSHQHSLHAVDEKTGLSYRTLLGELIAIDSAEPKALDLPALRSALGQLDPGKIATLEEVCAPLAKYWLPAKFEDSPLSIFKPFSADRATIDFVIAEFNCLAENERARDHTFAETSGCVSDRRCLDL